jgi:tetratricopeptide (TPR) repeat protein
LRSRPAWSVENLVEKLRDQRHRLVELEAGSRSVAATLESSYQDLDPQVRRGYRLLGLHPGAQLDSYTAAALLDAGPIESDRLIDQLIDAHLLQEPAPSRFGFHDLVREHARATSLRDDTEPDRRAAVTRLLDYYRHVASAAMDVVHPHERSRRPDVPRARTPVPAFPDPIRAGAWIEGELPNLVAAAQHAAEHGWPEHVSHLGATLHRYLYDQGRSAEAATLHQHSLAAARAVGAGRAEADALVLLGKVHWWFHSRLEQAGELFELAVATAQTGGHHLAEVQALTALGAVRSLQGAYGPATDHFAAARAGVRHVSDHGAEVDALYFLAWHRLRHGEPAMDEFEQCLALARTHGDRNGEWLALHGLGYAHGTHGRFEQAIDCFEQALRISRAVGDQRGILGCLVGVARAHRQAGRGEQATSYYQQAIDLAREVGNPNWECEAVYGLGRLACATGRAAQALALFTQALDLSTKLGRPVGEVRTHDGLAHAHRLLNQRDHARRHWQRALDILTDLGLEELGTDITYDERITTTTIRTHVSSL